MNNTGIEKFWSKVDKTNTCWIWKGSKDSHGYGQFTHEYTNYKSHRLSYELTQGSIPKGLFVCHSCDNPKCVNPAHLWLGTLQDNHRDMMMKHRHGHGTHPGSQNPAAKLTEQQVLEIRSLPGPRRKLAEQYGVSKATIDDIKTRKTWRHI